MLSSSPQILALDFDGVLCDGLAEYFQSSKRAYEQIWDKLSVSDKFEDAFARVRPVIETGWEMPVLLRALALGMTEADIQADWLGISTEIVNREKLETVAIAQTLDQVRDQWIESDLESWLELQKFYPGVIAKMQRTLLNNTKIYIVSTKEGRFVQELLQQAGVKLAPESIIGKESKQPKYQTLTQLLASNACQPDQLWFVEDRLKALQLVEQQSHLEGVGLFLASWGYNTSATRSSIKDNPRIKLLSLEQFQQDFEKWTSN
ncbi:HAD family hydrolase [Gloeocapsa sp. PCC 73106]|uniref:HAD family hydrolase n=1 Tax=Gloeocapsa sp. PCC 73106 TaxID=102232 RepID=UPI0002ACF076|nr:HAD hydrolase-like protein [Gloeocapsa sp. PCC 73106]ELR99273.1 hypothetical protein GLO73106DRAFT_00031230 [Gloeocapsa sp. PCC 73106]